MFMFMFMLRSLVALAGEVDTCGWRLMHEDAAFETRDKTRGRSQGQGLGTVKEAEFARLRGTEAYIQDVGFRYRIALGLSLLSQ